MPTMRKYCTAAFVIFIVISLTSVAYAQSSSDSLSSQELETLFRAVMNRAETQDEALSCALTLHGFFPTVVGDIVPIQELLLSNPSDEGPEVICGTPAMLDLINVVERMGGDTVHMLTEAIDLVSANLNQTHTTSHFEIKYTLTGDDATTNAFVNEVANRLEESYSKEVDDWGYRAGNTPLSTLFRVDIEGISAPPNYFTGGIFNPLTDKITINKDLVSRDDGLTLGTCAHEYHHASEQQYLDLAVGNLLGNKWFIEGSAAWIEHEVFNEYFPGNTTDDDFRWFRNRMNRYLSKPHLELTDYRDDDGYPTGLYFYFLADNKIVNFAGSGTQRNVVRDTWEALPLHGWAFARDAFDDGLADAAADYNSLDESFPYFAEANYFKGDWYPTQASRFRSVLSKGVDLTGSDDRIELQAPSPDVLSTSHYGSYYFEIDTDGEQQVNIDFSGNIVDRGWLGKVYPNFVVAVFPDGTRGSRELITVTNGRGNATFTCNDGVVVLTRLDDGNLLGTPDGGYTISFTRLPEPQIAAMDFENGSNGARIQSSIPGMFFTTTQGYDWIYGDIRTGQYNVYPYGSGAYSCNGNVFAWLGPNQGNGRIDFTGATARRVSMQTSNNAGLHLEAYDADGHLVDNDYTGGNLYTRRLDGVSVEGENIAYVIVHDHGNFWLIDDLVVEDLLRTTASYIRELFSSVYQVTELINSTETFSFTFENTEVRDLQLLLNWGGSEFLIEAFDPDGQLWGSWRSSLPPINTEIPLAAIGSWTFVVTPIDIPYEDYPFAVVLAGSEPPQDLTPPEITIASPVDGEIYFNGAPIHFDWYAEDPESGVISVSGLLDGMPIDVGLDTVLQDLGEHVLEVTATNGAGLSSSASVTFNVYDFEWLAPVCELDEGGGYFATITRNSTLPVKFAIYDPNESFVIDSSVQVVVEGTTAEFSVGERDTCVRIDVEEAGEEKYIVNLHTNFKHWDYGIQIGQPYQLKVFFGDILAHQVRLVVEDPTAKQASDESLPSVFALNQNYPNPFNPVTEISFSLPEASEVKLDVFNLLGQKVTTIYEGTLEAGTHSISWDGSSVASGVYLYRLTADEFVDTKKMVLLK